MNIQMQQRISLELQKQFLRLGIAYLMTMPKNPTKANYHHQ
jgi:hypothetical protein